MPNDDPEQQQVVPFKSKTDALAWCELSLTNWTIHDRALPKGLTRTKLEEGLDQAKICLLPASPKEFLVILDKVFNFGEAFGLAVDESQAESMTKHYRTALADLPATILTEAIERALGNHVYGHRLLLPAEIREQADPLLGSILNAKFKIELALRCGYEGP